MTSSALPGARQAPRRPAARFLAIVGLVCGLGLSAVAGTLAVLQRQGLLPAPPVTATWCFNLKFAFLRGVPTLADTTLLAVGSSAAWRNLDLSVFARRWPGTRPVNAAPCVLQIDQTAFLADFLLARMPRVDTVLVALAPRDFDACGPERTAFFDRRLAAAYVSGWAPGWAVHIAGFRPVWLIRESIRRRRTGGRGAEGAHDDAYGSSILVRPTSFWPAPSFDPRCYAALTRLEALAAARGARLVVATVPTMPAWAAHFDPDGRLVEEWTRRVADALRRPDTVLFDGRALAWADDRFADPAHLLYPHHTAFTDAIADALARHRGVARSGG